MDEEDEEEEEEEDDSDSQSESDRGRPVFCQQSVVLNAICFNLPYDSHNIFL